MLIEAVEAGATLEVDLCLVGGGAAGLSIAHLLEGSGLKVAVLEGGEHGYSESSQSLYMGPEDGTLLGGRSFYLTSSRLRYLGGSSNHWQGWCRPLDPLDFESRPWVERSGWPIEQQDLEPYYQRAVALAEISEFDYEAIERETRRQPFLMPSESGVETTFFHVSPPTRFGAVYGPGLEKSADTRLLLNANVTEIVTGESGEQVESVQVTGGDGQRYEVKARAFVLAAGAIENARLLLASRRVESAGIGNRNDLVGRYFMDHPLCEGGVIAIPGRRTTMSVYKASRAKQRRHLIRGVLRLSDALQRQEELLNAVVVVRNQDQKDTTDLARAVKTMAGENSPRSKDGAYFGELHITGEQTPNPESRVTLADETDALGVPRARLDWRLTGQDAQNLQRTLEVVAERLGARLLGRSRIAIDEADPWATARGSNHHMGTTRMDPDPARGVVDTDCRVHGLSNLFVAGSSVYPTVGASNPTLTLLALAVRMSDLLVERLR